jgi:hypothetical protein
VEHFLAATADRPVYVAAVEVGVSRPAIIRLRSGKSKPENLKTANVPRMRDYLDAKVPRLTRGANRGINVQGGTGNDEAPEPFAAPGLRFTRRLL